MKKILIVLIALTFVTPLVLSGQAANGAEESKTLTGQVASLGYASPAQGYDGTVGPDGKPIIITIKSGAAVLNPTATAILSGQLKVGDTVKIEPVKK